MVYPFRVSILDALFEIARLLNQASDIDAKGAVEHLRLGPADIATLNYTAAHELIEELGEDALAGSSDQKTFYRRTLFRLIRRVSPVWLSESLHGRAGVLARLSASELQCFDRAELAGALDKEGIQWWDDLASEFRKIDNDLKLATGREGEALTVEIETRRLNGRAPQWVSLEDNNASFDVLSQMESSTPEDLMIEVKATTFPPMVFFLSRAEWHKAYSNPNNYVLHLWILSQRLMKLMTVPELHNHIPNDNGDGEWQAVKVKVPIGEDWISYVDVRTNA